jgi:hypothetical protein
MRFKCSLYALVSGQRQVFDAAERTPMEPHYPLHGHGRGPLYRTVECRTPKTPRTSGRTSFVCALRGAGSNDLRNYPSENPREHAISPGDEFRKIISSKPQER